MTACVMESVESAVPDRAAPRAGFVIAADGSYAARLTLGTEAGAGPSPNEGEGETAPVRRGSRSGGRWTGPSRTPYRSRSTSPRSPTPRCCR